MRRTDTTKVLETIAALRCPCGHLNQRHRKPTGAIDGEVLAAVAVTTRAGLIDWREDDE